MLTVLGPQAHIPQGGNIRDNTAELLKVCGDIRDSTAELGKPLKLELKDVLHLPSAPVNLFSGQLFEQRTSGGYLKKGVLYTGSDEPVALIETTRSGHFLKVVKEPMFT